MENENNMWLRPSKSAFNKRTKIKLALWLVIQGSFFRFSPHKFSKFRIALLKIFGADIKENCFIHPKATIYMPWNFSMGKRSSIDFDTLVYSLDKVSLGEYVSISYKVNINTGTHDLGDPHFQLITKTIVINSGAFIGTESYISPGITIGYMAVIGARSVVTKDMPSEMICYGNPCRPVRKRLKKKD